MTNLQRTRTSRRDFFARTSDGLLGAALTQLLCQDFFGDTSALADDAIAKHPTNDAPLTLKPRPGHHPAKATSVIQLFMNGGPSQMDLFDPKPVLDRMQGKPFPGNVEEIGNSNASDIGVMMGGQYKFARHGESGMWMADILPETSQMVDDICLINSMWTDHPNHDNALYKIHSGRLFMGYPTLGAWTTYGLGTENQNLPAYVVLNDPLGLPKNGTRNWTAGFLPPLFQGTRFRPSGSPILNLQPQYEQPSEVTGIARDLLKQLDAIHRHRRPHSPQLDARIESYSLAARMQLTAGEALDVNQEDHHIQKLYGLGEKWTDSFGRRCLLARDWSNVGFVLCRSSWKNNRGTAMPIWLPTIAMFASEQTSPWQLCCVILSSEACWTPHWSFGAASLVAHQPHRNLPTDFLGRDHNMQAFSTWMAGGGIKGGTTYGTTDEFGHAVVDKPVSVHDFHATVLHLLGLHHQKLFFNRSGLEERLTGFEPPRVVTEILS